jgi:hypothetical protein
MSKLSHPEFNSLLKMLLIDAMYPDYIHIPGLGIRMPYRSYVNFIDDLFRAYDEAGEEGIILFLEKLKKNPVINTAVERSKKIIYSHLDILGIKDENDKQKYVSEVINSVNNKSL